MPPPMSLPYLTAPRWSWVPGARGRAGLLFSGLLAMGLCLAGPLQASSGIEREQLEALVDWHLPSAVADVQTWVRVPTVTAPPGSDTGADKTALLEAIAGRARRLGLETRLLEDRVLVVETRGAAQAAADALGILTHIDVVPAGDAARWEHPPFSGALAHDAIWGRGALDDKGPTAAVLHAMAALQELGLPLRRPVRLIIGSSEENLDWSDLEAVRRAGLVPAEGWAADASFPVIHAEKGFLNLDLHFAGREDAVLRALSGGTAPNSVPESARALLRPADADALFFRLGEAVAAYHRSHPEVDFILNRVDQGQLELRALGRGAHGSMPEQGVNAVAHLARLLHQQWTFLGADPQSMQARALRLVAERVGLDPHGGELGIDHRHAAMGRTTVNAGSLKRESGGLTLALNIRAPSGLGNGEIAERVARAATGYEARVEPRQAMDPLWVDPQAPLVRELLAAYAEATGETAQAVSIGGTTYAKAFPGFVAFGMALPQDQGLMHAPNEHLRIETLRTGMLTYLIALLRLAALPAR